MATHPKTKGPKPTFPQPAIDPPGHENEMAPKADHGEKSYKGSGKLEGKKTLITGGDSGIGRAVAIAYAREGADVAISYLPVEEKDARETTAWIKKASRKALLVPGDLSKESANIALVEQVVRRFGQIDVLVLNAAHQRTYEKLADIPSEDWEHTFATNIHAMFYLSKAAVPHMKKGSSIITTSSVQAYQPSPQLLAYAATKGAIVNFTKGLGQMLIDRGIRVNSVAPGPVWTPLIPSTMPKEKAKNFGKDSPMERPAQPKELAPPYVWLASEEASYVNASVISVTGGKPTM
jgi:NAD(P)-dependent dehydrogenase (short-subunit alcohol dehydrogenase family)